MNTEQSLRYVSYRDTGKHFHRPATSILALSRHVGAIRTRNTRLENTPSDHGQTCSMRILDVCFSSDRDLHSEINTGRIRIDPFDPSMFQPASIDVCLDLTFRVFQNHRRPHIDTAVEQPAMTRPVEPDGGWRFHPASGRVRARLDARGHHPAG